MNNRGKKKKNRTKLLLVKNIYISLRQINRGGGGGAEKEKKRKKYSLKYTYR